MAYIIRTIKLDGKRVRVKAWKGGITVYRTGYTETAPAHKLDTDQWTDAFPPHDVATIRRLWTDYRELEATQP